ncbi:signal peptidase I [Enterococcus sp. 669A]|uniref:Signal peptidase I n=1 Tax=Candidatus Enterococcus moelleringii TaxID=2815325 RepID=A0ABS3L6Z2_9ENTE|nr:signal peptidase I [Enterococcus sp. 669A]MBO1305395.1 signal peptidase I [Enterococcus sp. 669A]
MTRPREDRRRDYREPPSRYRDDPEFRPPPSNQRPARRYREEDEYYYDDRDRYNEPRREYPPPRRPQPRAQDRYDPRDRPPRNPNPRPYNARPTGDSKNQRPMPPRPRPYPNPRAPRSDERYSLEQAKRSTSRKVFLFIYNLFFYILTIGIILSAVMFSFSEKSDAAILGHRFYQVLTDSMAPQEDSPSGGFYSGDIVIVKLMNGSDVKEGDIVTFQVGEEDRYLTHRMVERLDELNGEEGDFIITKGDANATPDPPISADRVFGKVTFVIPKMGSVLNFIQENLWLCIVCVLSTFGFFLVLKAYFLQPEKRARPTKYPKGV